MACPLPARNPTARGRAIRYYSSPRPQTPPSAAGYPLLSLTRALRLSPHNNTKYCPLHTALAAINPSDLKISRDDRYHDPIPSGLGRPFLHLLTSPDNRGGGLPHAGASVVTNKARFELCVRPGYHSIFLIRTLPG